MATKRMSEVLAWIETKALGVASCGELENEFGARVHATIGALRAQGWVIGPGEPRGLRPVNRKIGGLLRSAEREIRETAAEWNAGRLVAAIPLGLEKTAPSSFRALKEALGRRNLQEVRRLLDKPERPAAKKKGTTTIKTRTLRDGSSVTTAKTTDPNLDLRTLFR